MTRVLMVGHSSHSREYFDTPIHHALQRQGAKVTRTGGGFNFFEPQNFAGQVAEWSSGVPDSLADHDLVLMLDWWNPALPLWLYRMFTSGRRPRLVGMERGSVTLEGDVATAIPNAIAYEKFLLAAYDRIIAPTRWVAQLMRNLDPRALVHVSPWPLNAQINRQRPTLPPARRVIYAHRWNFDKGPDLFEQFAELAAPLGIECIATAARPDNCTAPIEFVGWQSEQGLKDLCARGGYAWASTRQETVGYAVWNLLSWGLHPLLIDREAYRHVPDQFLWTTFPEALAIVDDERVLHNSVWDTICSPHACNAERMALEILEA